MRNFVTSVIGSISKTHMKSISRDSQNTAKKKRDHSLHQFTSARSRAKSEVEIRALDM